MTAFLKYNDLPSWLNQLSGDVVDSAYAVHTELGPGYLEKVYEEALIAEFSIRKIKYERQKPILLSYKDKILPCDFRLDLLVEDSILIELKAVETILPVHKAQVYSYLKAAKLQLGFLFNFNVPSMQNGIFRFVKKQNSETSSLRLNKERT